MVWHPFGGAAALIGSTTQLTAQGIVQEYLGVENGFSFFTFAIPGFLIIAVLVLYAGFIGYPLGKKIWGDSDTYDYIPEADGKKSEVKEPNRKKIPIMATIFILTMVLYMTSDYLSKYIPNLNVGTISIMSALACVITGCIDHKSAMKSINWTVAIWFCASLGIAAGLNKSGGGELLAKGFVGIFGENISLHCLQFFHSVIFLTQFL